jgi:hypothetical protein
VSPALAVEIVSGQPEKADGMFAATRVDLAFQSTRLLKLHRDYDGITIRVPVDGESGAIADEFDGIDNTLHGRPLVPESEGITDFVVTTAFAWAEDHGDFWGPGVFAGPVDHDGPPWELRPLMGIDGGTFATASPDRLIGVLAAAGTGPSDRQRYRYVWILMHRWRGVGFEDSKSHPAGIFLTREEAEYEQRQQAGAAKNDEWWITPAPIAI